MSKHQGLALTSALLLTLISTASFAEFRTSEVQEAENTLYIAIGGGGGGMNTSDWKQQKVSPVLSPFDIIANQPNHKTEGAGNGMAAIGYGFLGAPIRLELAYNFIGQSTFDWDNLISLDSPSPPPDNPRAKGEAKVFSNTIMLNGYLDFIMTEQFMPFIMGGIGYGINSARLDVTYTDSTGTDIEANSDRVNTSNFVWNAGLGANYALSEDWTIGLGFTYFYLGEMKVNAYDTLVQEDIHAFNVDTVDAFIATANIAYHW